MKQGVLVAVFLILTMLLGCSPKAPITLPPAQETSPSVAPQETQTPASSPTPPSPPSPPTPPSSLTSFTPTPTPTKPLPPMDAFQKGMNFADWRSFDAPVPVQPPHFQSANTERSLKNLEATGANWVALVVRGSQETIQSTDIFYKPPATATDEDLRRAVDIAHTLGFRVMLKPHVHLAHDSNHNHIEIGTAFTTEEQADCYQAALEVLWGKPWLAGIYWWDWLVGPAATSGHDAEYVTPQGKPAEEVLKRFYLSQ